MTDAITFHRPAVAQDDPSHRARGLQVGSGPIERAGAQVVRARLKVAGMTWDAADAETVVEVRAWWKRERWDEAMRVRPPPQRTCRRQAADAAVTAVV